MDILRWIAVALVLDAVAILMLSAWSRDLQRQIDRMDEKIVPAPKISLDTGGKGAHDGDGGER